VQLGLSGNSFLIDTTFEINYKADVTGYGMTIAGGYKDFFGTADIDRSFSILAEFGFGRRKSQMLNLTYRF
jgi:hypothetical protein